MTTLKRKKRCLSALVFIGLLLVLLFGYAASLLAAAPPARVRFGHFLCNGERATVTLRGKDGAVVLTAVYGEISAYSPITAGRYRVELRIAGEVILSQELGIGEGSVSTLYVAGVYQPALRKNSQTLMQRLMTMVEGAAAAGSNGYLPQLFVADDFFTQDAGKGRIRVINLLPGAVSMTTSFIASGDLLQTVALKFSGLSYPVASTRKSLRKGNYHLVLTWPGDKIGQSLAVSIHENALNSFYLIPRPDHYLTDVQVISAVTRH